MTESVVIRRCLVVAVTNTTNEYALIEYLAEGDVLPQSAMLVNDKGIDVNALIFAGPQDLTFDGVRIVRITPSLPERRRRDLWSRPSLPGWRG